MDIERDQSHRIQAKWKKWRNVSRITHIQKVSLNIKENFTT